MPIQKNRFSSRLIFEIPHFDNRNTKDRRAGIRCYTNPVVIFFLKLFGRIIENKGKTIYLNQNSLNNWLKRYKNEEFLKGFNLQKSGIDGLISLCEQERLRRKAEKANNKNTPFSQLLADEIKSYGSDVKLDGKEHPTLTAFLALLNILTKENIQGEFDFDSKTGEFGINLKVPAKYWIPPTEVLKPHLPKGMVFLFGDNKECEILGRFDKNNKKFIFEKGFEVSAVYGWTHRAKIESLFHRDDGKLIAIIPTNVPGFSTVSAPFKFDQFLRSVEKREKVEGNHGDFLAKK